MGQAAQLRGMRRDSQPNAWSSFVVRGGPDPDQTTSQARPAAVVPRMKKR